MKWEDVTEDDMLDPVVFFSFSLSYDKEPDKLLRRVNHEWIQNKGKGCN